MLLQEIVAGGAHPLAGTVARFAWLLPILPLLGFVINGALSVVSAARIGPDDPDMAHGDDHSPTANLGAHVLSAPQQAGTLDDDHRPIGPHRYAGIVSIVGPGVLVLSFLLAWAIFSAMRSVPMEAPFVQTYFSWMPVGTLQMNAALQLDQLSMLMVLVVTGSGSADSHLQRRLYARRSRLSALLRVPEPVRVLHARAGAGRELSGAVRRMGRRRTLLLSAHRLLVLRQGERRRGQEGVHRQPHRRLRIPGRDVHAVRAISARSISRACLRAQRRFRYGGAAHNGDLPVPVPGMRRQERADSAVCLAA